MSFPQHTTNNASGKSITASIFNHKREFAVALFGLIIIAISLVFFFGSLNKAYIGVSLHLTDNGWAVQSLDSAGLGAQAGIKIGDIPVTINGQHANDFLQQYEKQKKFLGITLTDLTVQDNTGKTISVTVENTPPPPQYITEIIPYLIVCVVFWLTAFYVFVNKPRSLIAILLLLCS